MPVSIPPQMSVSSFMGYLKGKSALMIFDAHANLKYKFGNRHFWAEGYYVSTVGINEATIRKYIQDQDNHNFCMSVWGISRRKVHTGSRQLQILYVRLELILAFHVEKYIQNQDNRKFCMSVGGI